MKIFVAGNPLVEKDSMPVNLLPWLKEKFSDIEFIEFDPTENLEILGRNPVIIDTVEGIEDFVEITDIEKISEQKIYSLHDFDLGINLKLMKKLGMLDSVIIIGIPMDAEVEEVREYLKEKISEFL